MLDRFASFPILALKGFAPEMIDGLERILKVSQRRRQEVRAASTDGFIVNLLWEKLDAGLIGSHNGHMFVGIGKAKDEESGEDEVIPLQTSEVAESFKWTSREVRRVITSLQITPDTAPRHPIHTIRGMRRAIFIAPGKMEILLSDFIPDYEEGTLARRITQAGLDVVTLDTLVTDHGTAPRRESGPLPRGKKCNKRNICNTIGKMGFNYLN